MNILRLEHSIDDNTTLADLSSDILGGTDQRKKMQRRPGAGPKLRNIEYFLDELVHFEKRWEALLSETTSRPSAAPQEKPKAKKEDIRTVALPLHQILQPSLTSDHYDTIKNIFDETQSQMTELKTNVALVIRVLFLKLADGSLTRILKAEEQVEETPLLLFDIKNIVPEAAIKDEDAARPFPLAPLDPGLQALLDKAEDSASDGPLRDLDQLFSQGHIQFLQSWFFGNTQERTTSKHPLWTELANSLGALDLPMAPKNTLSMSSAAARQMSTAMTNLWDGPVYKKLLDQLGTTILTWNLRPRAENLRLERSLEREAKKQARETSDMAKRKRFKDHGQSLFDELAAALRTGDNDKVQVKFALLRRKMLSPPPAGEQTHRQPLPLPVDADEEKAVGNQIRSQETPASSIRALKAVWKMLVESPAIKHDVDGEYVRGCLDKPEDFALHECHVVARLVNAVRPFVPKRAPNGQYPHSPALCAPLVLLADSVLRATGNHAKTREWVPDVKGSSLHSLHVTPTIMFQLLCSFQANRFDVHDSTGRLMDSHTNLALEDNKKSSSITATSLFIWKVMFYYMGLVDKESLREIMFLTGSGELETLGMTKAEVSREFKNYKEALTTLESEIKKATETLNSLELTRTMCRLAHKNAEKAARPEAYATLKGARVAVASYRKEHAEMERRYHDLKEQVWIWSQLKRAKPPADDLDGESTASRKRTANNSPSSSHTEPSPSLSTPAEPPHRPVKRRKSVRQQEVRSEQSPVTAVQGSQKACAKDAAPAQEPSSIRPATWNHHNFVEDAAHVEIESLLQDSQRGFVAFGGTDNGIVTTTATSRATVETLMLHLNHAYVVSNDARGDKSMPAPMEVSPVFSMRAGRLNKSSRMIYNQQRRKRRLARAKDLDPEMAAAYGKHEKEESMSRCRTKEQIIEARIRRASYQAKVQEFEHSRQSLHDARTAKLFDKRTLAKLCAEEQRFVCGAGHAGLGINSPIRGHCRRGGYRFRQQHARSTLAIIVNENKTTKICGHCFDRVRLARARKRVGQKIKVVTTNGSVECTNKDCPTRLSHRTIRNRDGNASTSINVSGFSALLAPDRKPLHVYRQQRPRIFAKKPSAEGVHFLPAPSISGSVAGPPAKGLNR
ncbi:hypothetical protein BGZ70_002462 [Mortierella alpina]|uniref:Uncharacterized protein n=1 Tax=Mortierella alpina TaxID=64518 RepID=A0A9P6JF67_MORAP|nr:hypothetical protein BGZ70_002462 [Mortierella alpina]